MWVDDNYLTNYYPDNNLRIRWIHGDCSESGNGFADTIFRKNRGSRHNIVMELERGDSEESVQIDSESVSLSITNMCFQIITAHIRPYAHVWLVQTETRRCNWGGVWVRPCCECQRPLALRYYTVATEGPRGHLRTARGTLHPQGRRPCDIHHLSEGLIQAGDSVSTGSFVHIIMFRYT